MRRIAINGLLILLGIFIPLALLTLLMMLFPRPFVGAVDYYEREFANQSLEVHYRHSDGDLFVALPNRVRPPADDALLAQFVLQWDAQGFRVPTRPADEYPIAVFGDSFTESVNVPKTWADVLAEQSGIAVGNYGYHAYGPLEVARTAQEVLPNHERQWVIYAYFSGNDLGDALRTPKVDTRNPFALWGAFIKRLLPARTAPPPQAITTQDYDFPMPVIIGGNYYEMAFLGYYLWWQVGAVEDYLQSANFAALAQALNEVSASAGDACQLVVFVPTKEQLYYPYIHPDSRQWLRAVVNRLTLDEQKALVMLESPISAEQEADWMQTFSHHRQALETLVNASPDDWHFLDLTPAFESAVADGQLLYYPYDTHWNQNGHDLAGQTIADYLKTSGCGG